MILSETIILKALHSLSVRQTNLFSFQLRGLPVEDPDWFDPGIQHRKGSVEHPLQVGRDFSCLVHQVRAFRATPDRDEELIESHGSVDRNFPGEEIVLAPLSGPPTHQADPTEWRAQAMNSWMEIDRQADDTKNPWDGRMESTDDIFDGSGAVTLDQLEETCEAKQPRE